MWLIAGSPGLRRNALANGPFPLQFTLQEIDSEKRP